MSSSIPHQRRAPRSRALVTLVATVVLGTVGSTAWAAKPGTLYLTDHAVNTRSGNYEEVAKKANKAAIVQTGGSWHIYFLAWLKKPAGDVQVNVVFYDLANPKEEVNALPIATQATAQILQSDVSLMPDMGFKAGKKYAVLITRLVGGKEDVYARTTVTLK